MMFVIKRDGRIDSFEKEKVSNAMKKAFIEVDGELNEKSEAIVNKIADDVASVKKNKMSVEDIQDMVVNKLMATSRKDVASRYVEYRYQRKIIREANTTDETILELLNGKSDYWNNENSNKNAELVTTQRDYMAGIVSEDISKRFLIPQDVVKAHEAGIIHFHDMDYFGQNALHNCFSVDTEFVTSNGIKKFSDFNDGDAVVVLDKDGVWRDATVKQFGKQEMYDITFKSIRRSKTVTCTKNHRWILNDGTVTTSLNVGDSLIGLVDIVDNYDINTYDECNMFTLGFLVGDGCDHVNANSHQIRLCGHKTEYADIFKKAGYKINNVENTSDLIAYKRGVIKQDFIDSKAWKYMDKKSRALLFLGLYAADGATNANKICTADKRVAEFIRDNSCLCGYHIASETVEVRDTNYKEGSELIAFRFSRHQPVNQLWKVESIVPHYDYHYEDRGNKQEVNTPINAWCVVEPVTHSFTLSNGMVTGNCDLVNLEDMLQNGTVISGVMIEKPHSFATACNIATQIIAQVASSQYGGQTISLAHIAPFVDVSRQKFKKDAMNAFIEFTGHKPETDEEIERYNDMVDSMVKEEIKRGVQTIQYQVVTLMTTNGQAPFLSVNMYLNEAKGEQTKDDLALIIEEVLNQRIQGVKNEKDVWVTPAFPKLLYVLEKDNAYEGSRYFYLTELAAKCTAKRLVPDYISEKKMLEYKIDKNGEGNVYPCMGCRSFLTPDRSGNGYNNVANAKNYDGKSKYYGRFNQGVVTINLPDVALSSGDDMDKFWEIFEERTELCHRALRIRHNRLEGTVSDVAPILWQHGALARLKKGETIDKLLYGGYSTLSLGYAGLYECVKYMTGHSHTDGDIGEKFGLEVMQALNDKCTQWKEEEDIDYSLYGTPIESTTYKFANCLKKRFGEIEGITDKNYITNSYHVHVTEEINAFDKLSLEAKFQKLSPGGAISYVEVPNLIDNIDAVIQIIQFIYENIMYAELNTKSDYCMVCGYDKEILIVEDEESGDLVWECPNCGNRDQNKMSVARRTCGYIGTNFWNQGRTQEIKERVLHVDDMPCVEIS